MKKSKVVSSLSLLVGLSMMLGSCLNVDSVTPYQRTQEEIAKIEAYLVANPPDEGDILVRDAYSGIRMVITDMPTVNVDGEDPVPVPPTSENLIVIGYQGRLFTTGDLIEADDSYVFTLTDADAGGEDVIDGLKFALSMMYEGMKATVYMPSGIAYGSKSHTGNVGNAPANSIIVYDIELKSVNRDNEEPRFTEDMNEIANALAETPLAIKHPNGFSYINQSVATGTTKPGLYDQVEIKYTGRVLGGDVFTQDGVQTPTVSFSSRPVNYIHGLSIGLQLMQEGEKKTFYIPSALAYGIHSNTGIPANSILVFDVELVKVTPNTVQ